MLTEGHSGRQPTQNNTQNAANNNLETASVASGTSNFLSLRFFGLGAK